MPTLDPSAVIQVLDALKTSAAATGGVLLSEGEAVGKAITPAILVAEMTFIGYRIMFKANMIEQLTQLTRACVLLFLLLWLKAPQYLLEQSLDPLERGGQQVAAAVMQKAGTQGTAASSQPAVYWSTWLGEPGTQTYKLDPAYLAETIWQDKSLADFIRTSSTRASKALNWILHPYDSLTKLWTESNETPQKNAPTKPSGDTSESSTATTMFNMVMAPLVAVMYAGQILGLLFQILSAGIGSVTIPLFTTTSVVGGAYYAFYIINALGLAALPLLLFGGRQFQNIWVQYLVMLTALVLVPCLFYILSAVGYVFSTQLYASLFETSTNFPLLLKGMADDIFAKVQTLGVGAIFSKALFVALFTPLIAIMKVLMGVMLVAGFIAIGTAFGLLAIPMALRWNQAFTSEEILQQINSGFMAIQNAMGTGIGQIYGQALRSTVTNVTGAGRGLTTLFSAPLGK